MEGPETGPSTCSNWKSIIFAKSRRVHHRIQNLSQTWGRGIKWKKQAHKTKVVFTIYHGKKNQHQLIALDGTRSLCWFTRFVYLWELHILINISAIYFAILALLTHRLAPSSAQACACPRGRSLSSTNLSWHPAAVANPAFVDCDGSPVYCEKKGVGPCCCLWEKAMHQ